MGLLLALLLTTSTPSAESAEPVAALKALRLERPLLFEAPGLPAFPKDLPGRVLEVPAETICRDSLTGADAGPGTFFPKVWADAIRLRLREAGMLEPKAQARLDALGDLALVAIDAQGQAVRADSAIDAARARLEVGIPVWQAVIFVAGGVALGVLVGFGAGTVLSHK